MVDANPWDAAQAVVVGEATVVMGDSPVVALVVEGWRYGDPGRGVGLVVPYRPLRAAEGFAVFTPRFNGLEGVDGEVDRTVLQQAFLEGVNRHPPGARAWVTYLDRSR